MAGITVEDVRIVLTRPGSPPGKDLPGAGVLLTPTRVLVPELTPELQQPGILFDVVLMAPDGDRLVVERQRPAALAVLRHARGVSGSITLPRPSALPTGWPLREWATPDKLAAAVQGNGGDLWSLLSSSGRVSTKVLEVDAMMLDAVHAAEVAALAEATRAVDAPRADLSDPQSLAEWRFFVCRITGCHPDDLTFLERPDVVLLPGGPDLTVTPGAKLGGQPG